VRDTATATPIDFLIAGGHPGDGKPRGVRFPDPGPSAVVLDGKRMLSLPALIELNLASGLSAPDRPRDFDDVIQLIRANNLPATFAALLHPEVQAKYGELWGYAQRPTRDY
jgi:hypothetical protein